MPLALIHGIPGDAEGGHMHAFCAALFLTLAVPPAAPEAVVLDWSSGADGSTELAAVRREYVAGVNAHDAARAAALYTSDALAIFDDQSVVRGAAAVERRLAGFAGSASTPITVAPRRFSSVDNVGWETGAFTEVVVRPDGRTNLDGIYLAIYSRGSDGKWRIALEIRTTGAHPSSTVW